MGIFSKPPTPSAQQESLIEANRQRLINDFEPTKAIGVKKFADAMQFIYDKERRCFVVVEGPEDTFRDRQPYVVDFDSVRDVYMEVDEYWTEKGGKFEDARPLGQDRIPMEYYDKVFWRYNLYMTIVTDDPVAGTIRYRMNYDPVRTRIAGLHLMAKRGLELNGEFRGQELKTQSERIAAFAEDQRKAVGKEKMVNLARRLGDGESEEFSAKSILSGAFEKMKDEYFDEKYVKRMENISKHLDRAYRISRILGFE